MGPTPQKQRCCTENRDIGSSGLVICHSWYDPLFFSYITATTIVWFTLIASGAMAQTTLWLLPTLTNVVVRIFILLTTLSHVIN